MEIPLVLSAPKPGRLVYALPVWFRLMMAGILAVVAAALLMAGTTPGIAGWTVLAILLLALLYEDKWIFDGSRDVAVHRAGLVVAARSVTVPFAEIARLCIVPLAKGTIPGTQAEKDENAAALEGGRADDGQVRRSRHAKPFLNLEIECVEGTRYLLDHVPARRIGKLRVTAAQLADLCGKPVAEA